MTGVQISQINCWRNIVKKMLDFNTIKDQKANRKERIPAEIMVLNYAKEDMFFFLIVMISLIVLLLIPVWIVIK
jgi:hypothetical protein